MPQPFTGFSLQSLPLAGIARPSRGRLLPCGYPPACWDAASQLVSPAVSSTPALSRSCLIPPPTMGSLSTHPRARFPLTLEPRRGTRPFRQLHPLRSLHPPASPCAPARVASRRRSILSWVFASLEPSPSTPGILEPAQTPRGLSMSLPPKDPEHDVRDLATPRPGEATPTQMHRGVLVGRLQPSSGPARATSRRRSYSLGLESSRRTLRS